MPRMTEAEVADRYGEVVARYNSTRNAANVYEVRRKDGVLACSCPGWRFSKVRPRACRHTERVAQGLDDDQAAAERTARIAQFQDVLNSASVRLASHDRYNLVNVHRPGSTEHAAAAGRLLDALDASGLFAPREVKPYVAPSRGLRVITLDDEN